MNKTKIAIVLFCVIAVLASCKRTGPDVIPPAPSTTLKNIMVLNNGVQGHSDASIRQYNSQNKMVSECLFEKANARKLGDLGQDMLLLGSDYFISMNGSKQIWVTDIQLHVKKSIKIVKEGVELAPRCIATDGVKVYVSIFEHDGYVAEIDPVTYEYRLVAVGSYPEGIAVSRGKVYVVNSACGTGNTMSVIDIKNFTVEKEVDVNPNPKSLVANSKGTLIYICSYPFYGVEPDYAATVNTLQVYEVSTGIVKTLDYKNVMDIAMSKDDMLVMAIAENPQANPLSVVLTAHDAAGNKKLAEVVTNKIDNYYSLSADTLFGHIFVGRSVSEFNGDVKVFSVDGKQVASFDSKGVNPQKCMFL